MSSCDCVGDIHVEWCEAMDTPWPRELEAYCLACGNNTFWPAVPAEYGYKCDNCGSHGQIDPMRDRYTQTEEQNS